MAKNNGSHQPDELNEEDEAAVKSAPDDDLLNDEDADPMEDTDLEIDEEDENGY